MTTTKKRLPVWTSDTLQETIREVGPVGAATEALIWLGVGAAGLPLSTAGQREVARLLTNRALAPTLLDALQHLYNQQQQGGSGSGSGSGSSVTAKGAQLVMTSREPSEHLPLSHPPSPSAIGDDWYEFDG